MRVVEEIRRLRLQQLRAEYGSYVQLNKLLSLDSRDSTLNQIATSQPNSKTGKARAMGSDLARRLEEHTGKPTGWMDNDPQFDSLWPFPLVDRANWDTLDADAREHVQRGINALLAQYVAPGRRHLTLASEPALGYMHEPSAAYTASPEAAREAAERHTAIERARRLKEAASAPHAAPTGGEAAAPNQPPKRH